MKDLLPAHVFCERLKPLLRESYTREQLLELRKFLAPALHIDISPAGIVSAANRTTGGADETNYDAVWLRDSIWVSLGLRAEEETRKSGVHILKGMLRYLASPDQLKRMHEVIARPGIGPDEDPMDAIHIRFDGASAEFKDVMVGEHPQTWNHKQNDALGLFYMSVLEALESGELHDSEFTPEEWDAVLHLPLYFAAIRFSEMEDAGPWEELDRLNTSSVALATSSLERLEELLTSEKRFKRWRAAAEDLRFEDVVRFLDEREYEDLLELGYERVFKQLELGESPIYPASSPKFRKADAALLNLVYPARLNRLTLAQKVGVLSLVQPLVREVGMCRYIGDSYQGAGYWTAGSAAAQTDDFSSAEKFVARNQTLAAGTEAQWFFDSWLSKVWGQLYQEERREEFLQRQVYHFNRALAQLTGEGMMGADGKPVPAFAFPESYNVVVRADGGKNFAPSPITPLNWAKASNLLAIQQMLASVIN